MDSFVHVYVVVFVVFVFAWWFLHIICGVKMCNMWFSGCFMCFVLLIYGFIVCGFD